MSAPSKPKQSRAKDRHRRKRLRALGLHPIEIWVPDVRAPAFRSEAHRQSLAVASSTQATSLRAGRSNHQEPRRPHSSRCQRAADNRPFLRLTTVSLRHCDRDAVFKPRPNRPRSDASRLSRGCDFRTARPTAASLRHPSSVMDTDRRDAIATEKRTVVAFAAMLLSTRSARAAAVV